MHNGGSVDIYFCIASMAWFLWEVASIIGMDVAFKNKIMLHNFREVKHQQGFTKGI